MSKFISINLKTGLVLAILSSLTACNGAEKDGTASKGDNTAKTAFMLEQTNTPTKWGPDGSVIVQYGHCFQGQPGSEALIKMLHQARVDEIKFDEETHADAKVNNYEVSSPSVTTRSVALIKVCPTAANATCDKGNLVEHYYTNSPRILAEFEKSCGYSGADKWTNN